MAMPIIIPEYVQNRIYSLAARGNFIYEVLGTILRRFPIKHYDNTTRGDASKVTIGTMIFNTDDNAPNWSDGTNWRDAMGHIT